MHAIGAAKQGLMLYCTDFKPKGLYTTDGFNFVNSTTQLPSDLYETGGIWIVIWKPLE